MLRIQLCPESELENRYWWTVDIATLVVCGMAAWFAADLALNSIRSDIVQLNTTRENWSRQIAEIQPAVQKFKGLDDEIQLLNRKLEALKQITTSKIDKILPIVVADQLQTLRPDGVWFHSLAFSEDKKIKLKGGSNDGLLISEFLLGLRETTNPDTISSDVRSQIGFENIAVNEIKDEIKDPGFLDISNVLIFEAEANVVEKKRTTVQGNSLSPMARTQRPTVF